MFDVLRLQLRFATDVVTERWGSLSAWLCFPISDLNFQMKFLFSSVQCYFTSTELVSLLGPGAQDVHLDFHTAPELWGVPLFYWLEKACSACPWLTGSVFLLHIMWKGQRRDSPRLALLELFRK